MQFDANWDEYLISYFEKIKSETKAFVQILLLPVIQEL